MTCRAIAATLASIALFMTLTGCDTLECADGTINAGGVCELALDAGSPALCCGPGTRLEAGKCTPDRAVTRCDRSTTTTEVTDDGVMCCVGPNLGSTQLSGCGIACKSPDPGKVTVCGQLLDVETGSHIGDGGSGARCDVDAPTATGPCAIGIRVYDALQFSAGPTAAPELVADEVLVNDCGAWMIHNVPTPQLGQLAIVTDDHLMSSTERYVTTASAIAVTAGTRYPYQLTYASRRSTIDTWTIDARDPFAGKTFAERGAALLIFSYGRDPVAGVAVAPQAYVFSDTAPFERTTVAPDQVATGINGSALVTQSFSATGAEPIGCSWNSTLADAVPGVLWVQHVHAEDGASGHRCAPLCPSFEDNPCLEDVPISCAR